MSQTRRPHLVDNPDARAYLRKKKVALAVNLTESIPLLPNDDS